MWVHTPFWLPVLLQMIYSSMISYPVWNVSFFLSFSNAKFFTIIFSHLLGFPRLIPAQAENKKAFPCTYRRAIKPLSNLGRFDAKKPFRQMGGQQNTIFKELHFIPVRYSSTDTRKSGSCLPQTLGTLYFPFWTNFNCHKHKTGWKELFNKYPYAGKAKFYVSKTFQTPEGV